MVNHVKPILSMFIALFGFIVLSSNVHAATFKDDASFYSKQVFSDVSKASNAELFQAVQWAYHNEILSGSNGKFNPNDTLTERQFVKMYANFFQFPEVKYNVQAGEAWDTPFYENVYAVGAPVKGYNNRNVRVANMTRGTFAQLVAFAHGKNYDVESAVTYLMDTGISTGQNPKETVPTNKFGSNNILKRSQAALFLYRMYKNNYGTLNTEVAFSKTYAVGGIQYVVKNATPQAYEIAIMHNGAQIGGYLSKAGTAFEGYSIGSTAATTLPIVVKNGKTIFPLVDTFDRKLVGIYWEDNKAAAQFDAMVKDKSTTKMQNLSQIAYQLTNVTRQTKNLKPLAYEYTLAKVAQGHSNDMVTNKFWSHTNLKNQSAKDRFVAASIPYKEMAENLAQASNVFDAHNALLNSKSHRETILNPNLVYLGVGTNTGAAGTQTNLFITYNYVRY